MGVTGTHTLVFREEISFLGSKIFDQDFFEILLHTREVSDSIKEHEGSLAAER
jgi:hypothetical protein